MHIAFYQVPKRYRSLLFIMQTLDFLNLTLLVSVSKMKAFYMFVLLRAILSFLSMKLSLIYIVLISYKQNKLLKCYCYHRCGRRRCCCYCCCCVYSF